MEAETINCPMCGAATTTDQPQCRYCGAQLATVSCPKCFAMMFLGSKHCPRCGGAAARETEVVSAGRKCPRCHDELHLVSIGDTQMLECSACLGLWLNTATFEKICADREQQAAVLGVASINERNRQTGQTKISYVPCPECSRLMNRANFARCSGVIVDLCKQHGIWFDRDELSRIIEFIRSGGLDVARAKEKTAIEEERRKLRQEQLAIDMSSSSLESRNAGDSRITGIASAGSLLRFLLD